MNWRESLDRYLTTPPNDDFGDWCEEVANNFSEKFWDEAWIFDNDLSDKWYNELYRREHDPKHAAKIIERAYSLFVERLSK